MITKQILFIGLIIFTFTCSFAQKDIVKSNKKVVIEGKVYYLHEVKKGETVYSICKAYDVSQSDMAIENPKIFDGLKIGQVLRIPENEKKKRDKFIYHIVNKGETIYFLTRKYGIKEKDIYKYNPEVKDGLKTGQTIKIRKSDTDIPKELVKEDTNYFYHKVEKKQTLYSLSKQYNVDQQVVIDANPQIKEKGLQYGEVIRIPKSNTQDINKVNDTIPENNNTANIPQNADTLENPCEYFYKKHPVSFKIALMLPFYKDGIMIYKELEMSEIKRITPKPFYEFYEGFLMAVENMQKEGMMIDLYVYDTKNDTAAISGILKDSIFNSFNLIVGPVFLDPLKKVIDRVEDYNTPVISPYTTDKSLLNYPFYFQIAPTFDTQVDCAINYMANSDIPNFVIVHNNKKEELDFIKFYKEQLKQKLAERGKADSVTIHAVSFPTHGTTGIANVLLKDTSNLIIIPSSDQVFVSDVVSKVFIKFHKNYDITLAGFPSWMKYENLPLKYFHEFSFTTFTHQFVDYSDFSVAKFLYTFRDTYKGEPSKYSFTGYDIGMYFMNALYNYGTEFCNCLDSIKSVQGLQNIIKFNKLPGSRGYENTGTYIIRYNDDYVIRELFPNKSKE